MSIKLPIITANKDCSSSCQDDAIEVTLEDPRCTALIFRIGEDLKQRGFEFEISQTTCKHAKRALIVFDMGPCGAQIVTFTVML